jgi:hypothetical protein
MSESATEQAQERATAPVSFRLSTYWKLPKNTAGITHMDSKRLALSEVLDLLLQHLTEEEAAISSNGTAVVLTIDWSKVPMEVLNPFSFGVRR